MVDHLDQTEIVDRELNVVKRARFNQPIETYKTNEVPEPNFGVEPRTVKELPALPVREHRQDNMLLHQQIQDNMLEDEVVSFGQRAQQQDQQQLQLRQHNIPHNPVYPKQLHAQSKYKFRSNRGQNWPKRAPKLTIDSLERETGQIETVHDSVLNEAATAQHLHDSTVTIANTENGSDRFLPQNCIGIGDFGLESSISDQFPQNFKNCEFGSENGISDQFRAQSH